MDRFKTYLYNHFEQVLILAVLLSILFVHYSVYQKMAFLNFYYLPVLLAGFFLGRRAAVLFGFFCVLLVLVFLISVPQFFTPVEGELNTVMSLVLWGSFLLLTGYITGTLFMSKEASLRDLKNAYLGVLEILSKYFEAADRYTKGHSVRVAGLATEIAIAMGLPRMQVENIKAAALLHDIGKVDVSMNLIKKASGLSEDEKKAIDTHSEKGAKILSSLGGVLKEAVPIVLSHHKKYKDLAQEGEELLSSETTIGACIVAVADAYDAITTDRPYRAGKTPLKALEEIEEESGQQFHPGVVKAFRKIFETKAIEQDENIIPFNI
jgi:putative nucleotidyltransferase with HDIG domain